MKLSTILKILRRAIRVNGRTLDDINPGVLTIIGLAITILPSIVENFWKKRHVSRYGADFLIDTSGFIIGEIIGEFAGFGFGAFVPDSEMIVVGIALGSDIGASIGWDILAEKKGWDTGLGKWIKDHHIFKKKLTDKSEMINSE